MRRMRLCAAIAWSAMLVQCEPQDRKSTRLNSSHRCTSYAVFCLKKDKTIVMNLDSFSDDIVRFTVLLFLRAIDGSSRVLGICVRFARFPFIVTRVVVLPLAGRRG